MLFPQFMYSPVATIHLHLHIKAENIMGHVEHQYDNITPVLNQNSIPSNLTICRPDVRQGKGLHHS